VVQLAVIKEEQAIVDGSLTESNSTPRSERVDATPSVDSANLNVYDVCALSDVGNERENNEDCVGFSYEGDNSLVLVVADGVGGYEGGEQASRMAVDVTLAAYKEQAATIAPEKRLYRAAQQANIEIYDRAIVVTELRNMSTTLTAVALEGAMLYAAHVGDSRLYLIRDGQITQVTKDHTVIAERVRQKLLSAERAKNHPDRGTLSRSLGRELIAAVDRITLPVQSGDVLVMCTDGLYNVLEESELVELTTEGTAEVMARRLIDTANEKGTYDNLSTIVCRIVGDLPAREEAVGWSKRLRTWLRSRA
jgi:serine/threonine protein phosphatase PrpC